MSYTNSTGGEEALRREAEEAEREECRRANVRLHAALAARGH